MKTITWIFRIVFLLSMLASAVVAYCIVASPIFLFGHLFLGVPEASICIIGIYTSTLVLSYISEKQLEAEILTNKKEYEDRLAKEDAKYFQVLADRNAILMGKQESEKCLKSLIAYGEKNICSAEFKVEHYTQTIDKVFISEFESKDREIHNQKQNINLLKGEIEGLKKRSVRKPANLGVKDKRKVSVR